MFCLVAPTSDGRKVIGYWLGGGWHEVVEEELLGSAIQKVKRSGTSTLAILPPGVTARRLAVASDFALQSRRDGRF